jgi:phospholipid-binding lipoprotein MlaA
VLALTALLPACADLSATPQERTEMEAANDPLEPLNRHIFDNNYFFDRLLVRPLAELYRATIPPGIRDCVAGILGNMKEPVIFANDLLQGELDRAAITFGRFSINTTLGIGGMWDVADEWGLSQQTGDFGQTLASWGVGEGPYLMLPLLGPTNARDALGLGVDIALSPWQYVTYTQAGTGALVDYEIAYFSTDALVKREKNIETYDAFREGSIDLYAKLRSAYRQHRREQLGQPEEDPPKMGGEGEDFIRR